MPLANSYHEQFFWLLLLSVPIACIAWTVTHEMIFEEPRLYCEKRSQQARNFFEKKFFYLFTCEYCFSHYISLIFLLLTHFHMLLTGWNGYLIAGFSLVWVANVYMSLFGLLRTNIKKEKTEVKEIEGKIGNEEN